MPLFTYQELQAITPPPHHAYEHLEEQVSAPPTHIHHATFDIFLAHSYADRYIIPKLKYLLEEMGYRVYVDWITDRFHSRKSIDKHCSEILRRRMEQSKCFIYATSTTQKSNWMPWEMGYFDSLNQKVAILPIAKERSSFKENFAQAEYLNLYCYIDSDYIKDANQKILWVNESQTSYISFANWLEGKKPYARDAL